MTWSITLEDALGQVLVVPPHHDRTRPEAGFVEDAELAAPFTYGVLFRFPLLHGHLALDTQDLLRAAVAHFGTTPDPDPWVRTRGNAGVVCARLLSWAELHPTGRWRVT